MYLDRLCFSGKRLCLGHYAVQSWYVLINTAVAEYQEIGGSYQASFALSSFKLFLF